MALITGPTALVVDTSSDLFGVLFTTSSQQVSAVVELALGSISFIGAVLAARAALRGTGSGPVRLVGTHGRVGELGAEQCPLRPDRAGARPWVRWTQRATSSSSRSA